MGDLSTSAFQRTSLSGSGDKIVIKSRGDTTMESWHSIAGVGYGKRTRLNAIRGYFSHA